MIGESQLSINLILHFLLQQAYVNCVLCAFFILPYYRYFYKGFFKSCSHLDISTFALKMMLETSKRRAILILTFVLKP